MFRGRDQRRDLARPKALEGPVVDDQRGQRVVLRIDLIRVRVRADPAVLVGPAQLVEQSAPAALVVEGGSDQQGHVGGGQCGEGPERRHRRRGEGRSATAALVHAVHVHVAHQVLEGERAGQQSGQDLAEPGRRDPDTATGHLLWVSDGSLSALEYSWYTDEAPVGLPDPLHVTVAVER
ncbi:hypothetical protein SANTM175S_00786 [Streptomyces antimycoticus]